MRIGYYRAQERYFLNIMDNEYSPPTWVAFHNNKNIPGEILFDILPDNSKWYEVIFYDVDNDYYPIEVLGDMIATNYSFTYCDGTLVFRYITHRIAELTNISFNKFKLIVDNINIKDYVRKNHPATYSKYNPVYDIAYIGNNSHHNFFCL